MGKSTWSGPVISLNGFIGGPDVNASDTQQGGTNPWGYQSNTAIYDGTNTLLANTNEGVLVYVQDGANGAATYAFSDGTTWLRCDTRANISAT